MERLSCLQLHKRQKLLKQRQAEARRKAREERKLLKVTEPKEP